MTTATECDHVFETLTAGPISKGSKESLAIEKHLAECPSCRDFAMAMRPGLHLIHEAIPVEQRNGLPVYLAENDLAVLSVMEQIRSVAHSTTDIEAVQNPKRSIWGRDFGELSWQPALCCCSWHRACWSRRRIRPRATLR